MKSACAVVLFLGVCSVASAASVEKPGKPVEKLTDEKVDSLRKKYADFDVDAVLANDRILTNYIKCVMGEGSCTAQGKDLKQSIPAVLETGCEKCEDKEKATTEKVIRHLVNKRPTDWDRLIKRFDPTSQYRHKYAHLLEKVKEEPRPTKDSKNKPGKPTKA